MTKTSPNITGLWSHAGSFCAQRVSGRFADHHLSKAQCWLVVSFHEYTRNERAPLPQAALTESEKLVVAMERGMTPLPTDTPLVGEAVMLRGDLWERARALRGEGGFECATQKTACAEGEPVRLGIDPARMSTSAHGDGTPVVDCSGRRLSGSALQGCLPLNRRVDMRLRATPC